VRRHDEELDDSQDVMLDEFGRVIDRRSQRSRSRSREREREKERMRRERERRRRYISSFVSVFLFLIALMKMDSNFFFYSPTPEPAPAPVAAKEPAIPAWEEGQEFEGDEEARMMAMMGFATGFASTKVI
jgi:hypothetical protein